MRDAGSRLQRGGVLLLLAGLALTVPACGAGGAHEEGLPGGSQAIAGLTVTTVELPLAQAGEPYPVIQLEAAGAPAEAMEWSLWNGALPPGLHLEPDGRLYGTPERQGFFVFAVRARAGPRAGTGTLALPVEAFGVAVQSGLVAGEAWGGRPVRLRAAGQSGSVSFAVVANESGGRFLLTDRRAGTATWQPGTSFVGEALDVLRTTDVATGRVHELALTTRPDPTAGCAAEFGSSDVWYVDTERRHGTHAFGSDFHAALEAVGLRGRESTDMLGTQADQLAALWVRLELLRQINLFYGRESGGGAGAAGLAVSFPFEEPGPGYRKPVPGTWIKGAPHHFSVIAVVDGAESGVVGTAFVDDAVNGLHENDTGNGVVQLGAFVNVVTAYFNTVYDHRELRAVPIDDTDLPALHALLHGLPSPGGRHALIERVGRDFARVLATIIAHEIGHSLGLAHTAYSSRNSLMSASAAIAPWSQPAFLPEDVARLRARLPGPGRGSVTAQAPGKQGVAASTLPEGGVCACDGETCNLRLPPPDEVRPIRPPGAGGAPGPRSGRSPR